MVAVVQAWNQVADTVGTGTTVTATLPNPVTPGNTVVLCCSTQGNVAWSTPTGFTSLVSDATWAPIAIFARQIVAGDGHSWVCTEGAYVKVVSAIELSSVNWPAGSPVDNTIAVKVVHTTNSLTYSITPINTPSVGIQDMLIVNAALVTIGTVSWNHGIVTQVNGNQQLVGSVTLLSDASIDPITLTLGTTTQGALVAVAFLSTAAGAAFKLPNQAVRRASTW